MAEQIVLRRQRDDEMASAAVIQRALLPKVDDFVAETGLDVSAAMTPARDVGGDFFDLVSLADGRVAIGVGGVCAKACRQRSHGHHDADPHSICATPDPLQGAIFKANAYLANNDAAELFATLLYAAFDPRSGEVQFPAAGTFSALRRTNGCGRFPRTAVSRSALFDDPKTSVSRAKMRRGDLFSLPTVSRKRRTLNEIEFGERNVCSISSARIPTRPPPSGWRGWNTRCAISP